MRYYINRGGNPEGPLDEQTIVGMIGRGELNRQAHICPEGGQAWQALDSHPPFASALAGPAPQAFGAQPQAFGSQPQAFGSQPQAQPYQPAPQQPSFEAQAYQATNQAGAELNQAANAFGQALGPAGAPGSGFFELARAQNQPIPDSAKAAASQAHLFAALGTLLTCGPWGGLVGAFVANLLYKDQPKHPFAQYHINQALVFQAALFVVMVVTNVLFSVLRTVSYMIADILGHLMSGLYLVTLAIWIGAVVLAFLQNGKAKNGEWSEYPKVGKFVLGRAKPFLS